MKPLCGKARETPDLKKEGEQCGYPPNGTVCAHDHVYGICEEGLFCQIPWIQMCVPGICTKNETGKIDHGANDPKSCCKDHNVPKFCLGLCMTQDEIGARSMRMRRPNACSKYENDIEKCVQNGLPPV